MVRAQFGPTVEGDVGCSGGTPSFLGSYGNQRALELCDASGDGEHHAPGQRRRRPRVPQQIEVQRFSPRSSLRCAHTQVAERHAAGFTALAYVSRPFLSHARSIIVATLKDKGAHLAATEQPVDTSTAAGKAFFDMLGVFAEFETNLRRERQAEGIVAAKQRATYRGRPPSIDMEAIKHRLARGLSPTQIARELRISRGTVYKARADMTDIA